jgi:hypothetical protein
LFSIIKPNEKVVVHRTMIDRTATVCLVFILGSVLTLLLLNLKLVSQLAPPSPLLKSNGACNCTVCNTTAAPIVTVARAQVVAIKPPPPPKRRLGIATLARSHEFASLRDFVGSIHLLEHNRTSVTIFCVGFSGDQLAEASLFLATEVVVLPLDVDHRRWIDERMASLLYIVVPLDYRLIRRLCNFNATTMDWAPFFRQSRSEAGRCFLQLRSYWPAPSSPPPPRSKLRLWCICIASYAKRGVAPGDQSIVSVFLRPFLASIAGSRARFDFAVYIGTQVDRVWDDPGEELRSTLERTLGAANVSTRFIRYPLNPQLVDITFKYNQLIRQAYVDGCDYAYQFSDDAAINSPAWAETIADYLDARHGFGTAGMRDMANSNTMTLGASGRVHIEINDGFFWPPALKNWLSDDYIQQVYGGGYSHRFDHIHFTNTQKHGQRYVQCANQFRRFTKAIEQSRFRAWQWAAQRNYTEIAGAMKRSYMGYARYRKGDFAPDNDTQLRELLDGEQNLGAARSVLRSLTPEDRLLDDANRECPIMM